MTDATTAADIAYVRLNRNALTFAESYGILQQSGQLHLLPFKWTRLAFGKLFGIRALHVHAAPAKMLLAPQNDTAFADVSASYPELAHVSQALNVAGFVRPQMMKNADPRNEFPNYMLFSVDPAAVVGVNSVVMDVGSQVAAWTDMVSVRSDGTILVTSNHPESGKLRPRPGAIHQRVVHADVESLYDHHRATISEWPDTKSTSVDEVIQQVCLNYEKQINYWLQCGLYVADDGHA